MLAKPPVRRRKPAILLAVLGAVIAVAAPVIAPDAADAATPTTATYYVDCGRATSGSGTITAPWNSLKHVNTHAAFLPGEQILLKRGSTCTGRLQPHGNGKANAPILIGAYGSSKARPTINGGGTADRTATVELVNQAHWTIQDLHLTNRGAGRQTNAWRSAVLVKNESGGRLAGITIQRLQIDSVTSNLSFWKTDAREWGGISVLTWPYDRTNSGFDGLQVLSNTTTNVGRTGIVVSNHGPTAVDHDVRIANNRVTRARGDSIVLRGSSDARIDHNVSAYGADLWPCPQCGAISPYTANAAIWPSRTLNVLIDHNEVYGEHSLGGDGEGLDVDASAVKTTLEYNYIHDNEGGGILFCGSDVTTARFNIIQNNKRGEFVFIGSIPATNTAIYNNTVYTSAKNGAHVVHLQGNKGGKGIKFYNNLVYNMGWGYYEWPAKVTTRNNTVVGTHGVGEPRDPWTVFDVLIVRNPGTGGVGFRSLGGYHPSSPKDDGRGIAIPKSVTKDFFGNTINPKSPPRGAALK